MAVNGNGRRSWGQWSNAVQPNSAVPPRPAHRPAQRPAPSKVNNTNVSVNKIGLFDLPSLPPLSFTFSKTVVHGGGHGAPGKALPGSGFTSDEDIRSFSEAIRKEARPRAVERSLDAETLESVLRAIPDVTGSLSGSRARARRVSKHLKRIAAAEKLIAKQGAAMYATFTREFEAELSQISRARARQAPRAAIWKA